MRRPPALPARLAARLAVCLVVATVVLGGCSGDGAPLGEGAPGAPGARSTSTTPSAEAVGTGRVDVCRAVSVAAVAAVVGGPVTQDRLPGGRGCDFLRSDAADPTVTLHEAAYDARRGVSAARARALDLLEGASEPLPAGFVVVGPARGGEDQQGVGAVRVRGSLVEVVVTQSAGLSAARVRALVVGVLDLVSGPRG